MLQPNNEQNGQKKIEKWFIFLIYWILIVDFQNKNVTSPCPLTVHSTSKNPGSCTKKLAVGRTFWLDELLVSLRLYIFENTYLKLEPWQNNLIWHWNKFVRAKSDCASSFRHDEENVGMATGRYWRSRGWTCEACRLRSDVFQIWLVRFTLTLLLQKQKRIIKFDDLYSQTMFKKIDVPWNRNRYSRWMQWCPCRHKWAAPQLV